MQQTSKKLRAVILLALISLTLIGLLGGCDLEPG